MEYILAKVQNVETQTTCLQVNIWSLKIQKNLIFNYENFEVLTEDNIYMGF